VTVKNTFISVVNPSADVMRPTKSMPVSITDSLVTPSSDHEESESESECSYVGAEWSLRTLSLNPNSPVANRGLRLQALGLGMQLGCDADASEVDESSADVPRCSRAVTADNVMVKNTFLTVEDESEDQPIRPTKSVPLSFRPHGSERRRQALSLQQSLPGGPVLLQSMGQAAFQVPQGMAAAKSDDAGAKKNLCLSASFPEAVSLNMPVHVPLPSAVSRAVVPMFLRGQVWRLSQDGQGCRVVQQALDQADSEEVRRAIARELTGHVWEATTSPHGNFVVQKCIEVMPAAALDFVINELCLKHIAQVAKNKFGCRVIQRLVEKCPSHQVGVLVEAILIEANEIARHPYGNYVVQHLLVHAEARQKQRLVMSLASEIKRLAVDTFGCAVISTGSSRGVAEHQLVLAQALLREPDLLVHIACTRHGHVAAARVLQVLRGVEREHARRCLSTRIDALRASRFGRLVVASL